IRQAGNKFVICEALWTSVDVAKILKRKEDETYSEASRFSSEHNKRQGELHALLRCLPEESRGLVAGNWEDIGFYNGMSAQRSNTSSRLRNEMEAVFNKHLGEHGPIDLHDDSQRKECRELIGGEVQADNTVVYHHFRAPILHSDLSKTFNKDTFLRHKLIMHTLWALSPDTELRKKGAQSSLNYSKFHEEYLKYLLVGIHKRKKPVLEIFKIWDAELFPDTDTSIAAGLTVDGEGEGDLDEALQELERAESVPLDGENEGAGEGAGESAGDDAGARDGGDESGGEGAGSFGDAYGDRDDFEG
ncbi:hypothetical protein GGX14DRAFT_373051, partial [Mycena pura]